MQAFESLSTWLQPAPAPASAVRTELISDVAAAVARRGPGRLRVAVDGLTAAGKTCFGHELAAALRGLGRPTLRACLDDFKNPWREARELGYDPLTGEDHRDKAVSAPEGAVLIVDSVFAFRPEYNDQWELRIWLDVGTELSLRRGIARDAEMEGIDGATRLHRDRYHAAEMIYLAEVSPRSLADVVIDNRDFANPRILAQAGCGSGSGWPCMAPGIAAA